MEIRSFLAFELPGEMRDALSRLSSELRPLLPGARWVRAENIHLTVVFLGQVPESSIEGITGVAKSTCDRYGAFDIGLKGVGVFSGPRNPRVLWVGLQADLERMSNFRNVLQRKLRPFGVREEKRPFRPHLTLCRFKKGSRGGPPLEKILDGYQDFSGPFYRLQELILFKSDLTPAGSIYTKLARFSLAGTR
ncbi:MAG: RNA 2',3'-cyclic phosphodiesterase [Deltaproteobacteria bacterium]|nr:MAG: RNA 2',3'-cyclic phosphodiesterase [Deltaproteobacteria bacterium]